MEILKNQKKEKVHIDSDMKILKFVVDLFLVFYPQVMMFKVIPVVISISFSFDKIEAG